MATFLKNFGVHINILVIVKIYILMLIEWSDVPPKIMLTVESRMVIIF
jgi:hypothetical protein